MIILENYSFLAKHFVKSGFILSFYSLARGNIDHILKQGTIAMWENKKKKTKERRTKVLSQILID